MHIIRGAPRELSESEQDRVAENVALVQKMFSDDDGISYQELDSIENTHLYGDEDVVEIFIRANSGGTKLGKSDLMFALLIAGWDDAGEKIEDLIEELNSSGFAFERDLILKACLALQDLGATYNVERFRTPEVKKYIETNWERIASAFKDVLDFVRGRTFIRCDSALLSYLALIPLVYARYHFPKTWQAAKDVDVYLLRTLVCGVFGGHSDLAVNACVNAIRNAGRFDCDAVFKAIRQENKPLELPEDNLFRLGYGHKATHLIFNLWYRNFHYTPAFTGNLPQIDHIFPQSYLRRIRVGNEMRYPKDVRDQLANCMLLTQVENGRGGKTDILPDIWFANKDVAYLDMHLIPRDKNLWKLDCFEDFIAARKQLIREKFAGLI